MMTNPSRLLRLVAVSVLWNCYFIGNIFAAPEGSGDAPRTIEEGLKRLETVLGTFQSKDQKQFRMEIKNERENTPEPTKPPVLVDSKGNLIIGVPYRVGGAVAFDLIEIVQRKIYKKSEQKKELLRQQQRYFVGRVTLRVDDAGAWDFDLNLVAHSNPGVIGKSYMSGTVVWTKNGFKLVGLGTDKAFASDGSLIPVVTKGNIQLSRDGEKLIVSDEWKSYKAAADPDGNRLFVPDYGQPVGEASQWLNGTLSVE
jgi:hypothetical protein